MFLEKLVMRAAKRNFILVDNSKMVQKLGGKFAVPVEVLPMALHVVEQGLYKLGATEIEMRHAVKKDGPVIPEREFYFRREVYRWCFSEDAGAGY